MQKVIVQLPPKDLSFSLSISSDWCLAGPGTKTSESHGVIQQLQDIQLNYIKKPLLTSKTESLTVQLSFNGLFLFEQNQIKYYNN